jgi:hypothetical protein
VAGRNRLRRPWLLRVGDDRACLGASAPEIGAGAGKRSGAGRPAPLLLPVFSSCGPFFPFSRMRYPLPIRNQGYFGDVFRPRAPSSRTPLKNNCHIYISIYIHLYPSGRMTLDKWFISRRCDACHCSQDPDCTAARSKHCGHGFQYRDFGTSTRRFESFVSLTVRIRLIAASVCTMM